MNKKILIWMIVLLLLSSFVSAVDYDREVAEAYAAQSTWNYLGLPSTDEDRLLRVLERNSGDPKFIEAYEKKYGSLQDDLEWELSGDWERRALIYIGPDAPRTEVEKEAVRIAWNLEEAMETYGGTDEDAIYAEYGKIKSAAQEKEVRKYYQKITEVGLDEAFAGDLNAAEMSKVQSLSKSPDNQYMADAAEAYDAQSTWNYLGLPSTDEERLFKVLEKNSGDPKFIETYEKMYGSLKDDLEWELSGDEERRALLYIGPDAPKTESEKKAVRIAYALEEAMETYGGTDENAIYAEYGKIENSEELQLVRDYYQKIVGSDLEGALFGDLSDSEKARVDAITDRVAKIAPPPKPITPGKPGTKSQTTIDLEKKYENVDLDNVKEINGKLYAKDKTGKEIEIDRKEYETLKGNKAVPKILRVNTGNDKKGSPIFKDYGIKDLPDGRFQITDGKSISSMTKDVKDYIEKNGQDGNLVLNLRNGESIGIVPSDLKTGERVVFNGNSYVKQKEIEVGSWFSNDKSKQFVVTEKGYTVEIPAFNNDDANKGGTIIHIEKFDDEGQFVGYELYVMNDDGSKIEKSKQELGGFGGLFVDDDPNIPYAMRVAARRIAFNRVVGSFQKGASWSAISNLFGWEMTGWKQSVDEMFHDMFLGTEYWAEDICYSSSDLDQFDSMFNYDADGQLTQTATITATKQIIPSPEGTKYLYKITFYVRNPEKQDTGNLFGKSSSSTEGLVSRDSSSNKNKEDLEQEEKEFMNIVKKAGSKISNDRGKYSKTATNEDVEYNVELTGDKTLKIFEEFQIVEPGDEVFYTEEDTIVSYSRANYETACLIFEGELPRNAFFEEIDEICTDVVDISSSAATQIDSTNERTDGRNDDEYDDDFSNVNSKSSSRSSSSGSSSSGLRSRG